MPPSLRHLSRYREIAGLLLRHLRQAGLDLSDDLADLGELGAEPVDDDAQDLAARLEEWLEPVRAAYPDVALTARAVPEEAPLLLAHESGSASLLVVGSRGRDAFADLLLGSTSQDALFHARCPVAVVR